MSVLDTPVGQELSPLVKPPIVQEQLRRYAQASGDYNPIHLDEEAARSVGLDSVIAHGMLSMAFLGQYISAQIAAIPDARIASFKVRYVAMVRLGDMLTCLGVVRERSGDSSSVQATITIDCWAQNQRGEKDTLGEAEVVVPLAQAARV